MISQNISKTLISIIVFTLPLNYALTIPVGMNLKIYELTFSVLILLNIISKLYNYTYNVSLNESYTSHYFSLKLLFTSYIVSSLVALYFFYDDIGPILPSLQWATGRYSPSLNTPLALFYIAFSFVLYTVVLEYLSTTNIIFVMRVWLAGTMLSIVYLFYANAALFLPLPEILLPGMDAGFQYGNFLGVQTIRSGTFKEGNFLSGYLVISGIISYYLYQVTSKKYYLFVSVIIGIAILLSQSTAGLISVLVILLAYYLLEAISFNKFKRNISKLMLIAIFVAAAYAIPPVRDYTNSFLLDKIFATDINDSGAAYSKFDRLASLEKAYLIFKDHPIFGVGTYNFSFYAQLYEIDSIIFTGDSDFKGIPNNVYIQILAENGIITFICFIYFLNTIVFLYRYKPNKTSVDVLFFSLFISLPIKWLTFPTLTLAYDWVALAIITFILNQKPLDCNDI